MSSVGCHAFRSSDEKIAPAWAHLDVAQGEWLVTVDDASVIQRQSIGLGAVWLQRGMGGRGQAHCAFGREMCEELSTKLTGHGFYPMNQFQCYPQALAVAVLTRPWCGQTHRCGDVVMW